MKCPACSVVVTDELTACPGCGVDFAKWKARAFNAPVAAPVAAPPSRPSSSGSGLGIYVVVAALVAGGLFYRAQRHPAEKKHKAGNAAAAQEKQAEAPLSNSEFEALFQEYSAKLAPYNHVPSVPAARMFFNSGVEEIDALAGDFEFMAAGGVTPSLEPMTADEIKRGVSARCQGPSGMIYSGGPAGPEGGMQCWTRNNGRAHTTRDFIVIYSPVMPGTSWAPLVWQPGLKRWAPWTEEQYFAAARSYTDSQYGMGALMEAQSKAEAAMAKIPVDAAHGGEAENKLLEGYRARFRRAGALAEIDRLVASAGLAGK